ncbi:DUF4304 domain-containing protein [Rhodanobacter soli]|uniref:DUF4304 domain-containing protein n=1 Tax=Rhodanobacter soli TaxID=590609 RepID=UPI0033940C93
MSTRFDAFDRALREIAVPALSAHGFKFDGSRTFRRLSQDRSVSELVNFQLGQRSMSGKFTVNLGVYADGDSPGISADQAKEHDCAPARRTRLGPLIPTRFPALAKLPYIGFLFGPGDKWWSCSDDATQMGLVMPVVVNKIIQCGLPWHKVSGP